MKKSLFLLVLVAFCGACPTGALAQERTVALGTEMRGIMTQSISSSSAHVGQVFLLDVVDPYPQNDLGFADAKVRGRVVQVSKAGQGHEAKLGFILDRIALTNGASANMSAIPISVQQSRGDNIGYMLLTTAGGMLAGNIIGKWLGTNHGGAIGAVAGLLYGINRKTDVTVPSGSEVIFQLKQSLTLRT